jgi:hypothetical protein
LSATESNDSTLARAGRTFPDRQTLRCAIGSVPHCRPATSCPGPARHGPGSRLIAKRLWRPSCSRSANRQSEVRTRALGHGRRRSPELLGPPCPKQGTIQRNGSASTLRAHGRSQPSSIQPRSSSRGDLPPCPLAAAWQRRYLRGPHGYRLRRQRGLEMRPSRDFDAQCLIVQFVGALTPASFLS